MSTSSHLDVTDEAAIAAVLAEVRAVAAATEGDRPSAAVRAVPSERFGASSTPAGRAALRTVPSRVQVPGVQVLRWPAEAAHRDACQPCLWLLPVGELPPVVGPSEDWLRSPANDRDVEARARRLASRAGPERGDDPSLTIAPDGRAQRGGTVVHLPPIEASILRALASRADQVVSREVLCRRVWGDAPPSARALDSRIHALRGRVERLGLVVHTIRGRGFLLASTTSGAEPVPRWR
ncbi:MAG: winged helix-turn-helix domain-containing protein [Acidimicrobiales bacterium]|nr:winged helix-turn-helix transcriptional regulator [Acidimicrobiales bacterium]